MGGGGPGERNANCATAMSVVRGEARSGACILVRGVVGGCGIYNPEMKRRIFITAMARCTGNGAATLSGGGPYASASTSLSGGKLQ